MIPRLSNCLVTIAIVTNASAFSTASWSSISIAIVTHLSATQRKVPLSSLYSSSSSSHIASMDDTIAAYDATDDDVTCYITNDEEMALEGERPHIVCTSEPEEYAWYNGINVKAMRMTEDVDIEGNENCVLGESYTGKPEWECS